MINGRVRESLAPFMKKIRGIIMNAFYHEFTPDLWHHFYPYIAILFLTIMAVIGWRQHVLFWSRKRERYLVRQHYGESRLNATAMALSAILTTLIMFESYHGILQSLDNRLGRYESPIWSIVMMPFCWLTLVLVLWQVLFWFGFIFSSVRFRLLTLRKEDMTRKLAKMAGRQEYEGE